MIRNYATCCGAISLRIMFFFLLFTNLEVCYTLQAWLAYPVTFLISEIYIRKYHKVSE